MSAQEQSHPYHLVDPSPWPAVGSLAAFVLAVTGINYMHGGASWPMLIGVVLVLATMFLWFRDVINEGESGRYHTPVVAHGLRMGMALFIASEVMFFVAFFWAYFNAAFLFNPLVTQWPPAEIQVLETWDLPFLNTLILLASGLTLNWAHHALREGHRKEVIQGLAVTVALGIIFLACQALEYSHALFTLKDGVYPSTFYLATGFHGFHVFVGVCMLAVCLYRAIKGHFTPRQHVGFEAAAWYWHFVDVVWLFLFVWIYWWGSAGATPAVH